MYAKGHRVPVLGPMAVQPARAPRAVPAPPPRTPPSSSGALLRYPPVNATRDLASDDVL
jgi:hypothetical protein